MDTAQELGHLLPGKGPGGGHACCQCPTLLPKAPLPALWCSGWSQHRCQGHRMLLRQDTIGKGPAETQMQPVTVLVLWDVPRAEHRVTVAGAGLGIKTSAEAI